MLPHSHILECTDPIRWAPEEREPCSQLFGRRPLVKPPFWEQGCLGLDQQVAHLIRGETTLACVGVHQGDDELAHLDGRSNFDET
eukprot:3004960-Prymnesium_polylepis.3